MSTEPQATPAVWHALVRRGAVVCAALAVLAWVFDSYLQPGLIVELGNRLWSCL